MPRLAWIPIFGAKSRLLCSEGAARGRTDGVGMLKTRQGNGRGLLDWNLLHLQSLTILHVQLGSSRPASLNEAEKETAARPLADLCWQQFSRSGALGGNGP